MKTIGVVRSRATCSINMQTINDTVSDGATMNFYEFYLYYVIRLVKCQTISAMTQPYASASRKH